MATGYPPQATTNNPPPPYQQFPYPYNFAPPQPNPRATMCRRFLIFMAALFVASGAVVLTVWLVLRPRLPEFRVNSASLTNFTVTPSLQVAGTWTLGFQVVNPNKKMSISYDDVESTIFYKSQVVAQTRISPWDQGTGNVTVVGATYSAAGSYVYAWVIDDVIREMGGGSVRFNVGILAEVEYWDGWWRPRGQTIKVVCNDVAIGISWNGGSGNLVGGGKDCEVDVN